jgi:hypothetical protein
MTKRVGNILTIEREPASPDDKCELCGAVEETRPYGPHGERVCFKCGMKDEPAAIRAFAKLFSTTAEGRNDAR